MRKKEKERAASTRAARIRRFLRAFDVGVGTFFSNLVMFFIILTTALTLHRHVLGAAVGMFVF